jgi:hypothetical protein
MTSVCKNEKGAEAPGKTARKESRCQRARPHFQQEYSVLPYFLPYFLEKKRRDTAK